MVADHSDTLRRLAAGLSLVAGVVHLLVVPEHMAEAWEEGAFFLVVGVAQIAVGVQLSRRPTPALIFATIVGSLGMLALFIGAYTVGLPVGEHPWEPEGLGPMVVGCKLAELALVGVLVTLLRSPARAR